LLLDASGILDFIGSYSTYYIVGHKEPDGDCIGSQLALGSFLERCGKKTVLLSSGPFTRTEIATWSPRFAAHFEKPADESRGIIVLEVNTLPGLTGESLMPKALRAIGSDTHELVDHLIRLAISI